MYDEDMNELFTFNVSEFKNSMRCMQSILLLSGMPRKILSLSFKGAYYIKAYTWYDTTSQSRWRFKCYIDQFVRISL